MKEIIQNPGLHHIVRNVSSFLDAKSLAQCRLVCHTWRDLIDNDRPWLLFQLRHLHSQEKTFVDYSANKGKPKVKGTIQDRFPEWNAFIRQVSRKQSITRLKETVRLMWTYFNKDYMSYCTDPFQDSVVHSKVQAVQLWIDCGLLKIWLKKKDTKTFWKF